MGLLDVRVCEARGLADGILASPSTYCIVQIGPHQYHTVTSRGTDPKWEEVFRFQVADPQSTQLHIFIKGSRPLLPDSHVGCCAVSLDGLTKGVVLDKWFLLKECSTSAELRLRLMTHDFGLEAQQPQPQFAVAVPLASHQQGSPQAKCEP